MAQIKLYVIRTAAIDFITIKDLGDSVPILWCNGGIWAIIGKSRISNMYRLIEDAKNISAVHTPPEFKIFWDEVRLVPKTLAEIII